MADSVYKYSLIPNGFIQKINQMPINQRGGALAYFKNLDKMPNKVGIPENIEQSLGIKELFEKIKQNRDLCILYIPDIEVLFNLKDTLYPSKQFYYKDERLDVIVDGRPEIHAGSSNFSLGLICKTFFNLDIHPQKGINYITYKQCEQIVNSMFSFKDLLDSENFSKTFVSNCEAESLDGGYRFDSYDGILGLNFMMPFPFRLIFNTYAFNFYEYYNIDYISQSPFKGKKQLINLLLYTNQINCIFSEGITKADPSITPPAGLDWSNPLAKLVWDGQDRDINSKIKLDATIVQEVTDGTALDGTPQFGVYTPAFPDSFSRSDKYVFDFLATAVTTNKINNTSLVDYEFVFFELHNQKTFMIDKIIVYLPSSTAERPLVFMFGLNNFNLMVTNQPKKKSLFFSVDGISRQNKTDSIPPFKMVIPNNDLLTLSVIDGKLKETYTNKTQSGGFYFNISPYNYELKSIRIVKLFQDDCIKIVPDFKTPPTESKNDLMPQYKFNFNYEYFDRSKFDFTPGPSTIAILMQNKREKSGVETL